MNMHQEAFRMPVRARGRGGEAGGGGSPAAGDVAGALRESTRCLERRATQQSALAALARLALETRGSDELVDAAARAVADTIGAARVAVVEAMPDGRTAVMRAGCGWPGDTPLTAELGDSGDARGAELPEAGVVDGRDAQEVLPVPWRLRGATRAAVARVRPADEGPAGAIVALSASPHAFQPEEVTFLETAADIVAGALTRSRGEERARHQAMHDPLTGVANRTLFVDRVQHALARAVPGGGTVALLNLDLDRFKLVNESLGHGLGDELLVAVAQRILTALRPDDTLARLNGDEFAILSEGFGGERGAIELAERVLGALESPIVLDEREVFAAASIGIVVSTGRAGSAESLLQDVHVAMYRAKEHGGGRYELFDQAMRTRTLERLDLERDMRRALDHNEFELHYQPIVSLEEPRIVGLEALVRWRHPLRGLVAPGAFIPLAEDSGLILPLGRWVLQEACRQLARWSADPDIEIPYVSVNLSGRQLAQQDLPEELAELLRVTGVPAERLALELTESVLMEESDSPTAVLERLDALGVRLMLDDFGTGYSSLNYVKRFPIEAIKVDRSFVSDVTDGESDRHVLRAVVSMAAGFGVELVAEGVETTEQARWLRHLGITLAQGYAFARPAPAAATERLLREGLPLEGLADAFESLGPDENQIAVEPRAASSGDHEASMTLGEAAEALDVSTSTLRRWADSGRIETLRTHGGHRRFPAREVQRLSTRNGRSRPIVRMVPAPVEALPALDELLTATAPNLAAAAARSLYEGAHTGWFVSPSGGRQLERWLLGVASGARAGDYETTAEATRKLMMHASPVGTSLLERHTIVERLGELIVRDLQRCGTDQAQLMAARRLVVRLRQIVLEGV
jgi:diguanylate cyclase (GGDEF)-like protein/excisionase family DNA binding protein